MSFQITCFDALFEILESILTSFLDKRSPHRSPAQYLWYCEYRSPQARRTKRQSPPTSTVSGQYATMYLLWCFHRPGNWYVSTTLTQLGLEFREENARFVGWGQRLLQYSQVLARVKGRFALRP
jgi:hypothetical protein